MPIAPLGHTPYLPSNGPKIVTLSCKVKVFFPVAAYCKHKNVIKEEGDHGVCMNNHSWKHTSKAIDH